MSRFSGKNGSIMGYQKSSSIGSNRFKKAPGCAKQQDPSLHKKDWMLRFEPLFEEGKCYSISNFAIAENTAHSNIQDEMALIKYKFKKFIKQFGKTLYRTKPFNKVFENDRNITMIKDVDPMLDNIYCAREDVQDFIGSVIAIGDIVPVMSDAGHKIRKMVAIEDGESNQLDCTFWDNWATLWDEYAQKRESMGHVVFILQLGKVNYWDGTPAIHNALFGTKMFINRDLPEILSFRKRVKELPNYDETQFKLSYSHPINQLLRFLSFFMVQLRRWLQAYVNVNKNHTRSRQLLFT
ncbi:hypothetical protein OROHE_014487 [Orobanche hederae]